MSEYLDVYTSTTEPVRRFGLRYDDNASEPYPLEDGYMFVELNAHGVVRSWPAPPKYDGAWDFYQRMMINGHSPAGALRGTQLWMELGGDTKYRHLKVVTLHVHRDVIQYLVLSRSLFTDDDRREMELYTNGFVYAIEELEEVTWTSSRGDSYTHWMSTGDLEDEVTDLYLDRYTPEKAIEARWGVQVELG